MRHAIHRLYGMIYLGQECVCPDGVGRIVEFIKGAADALYIKVDTYVENRGCDWHEINVRPIALKFMDKIS